MEIQNLTINEEKLRDLYLRKLALGEIYGPLTGKPSQDKVWLAQYSEQSILSDVNNESISQSMVNSAIKYQSKISSIFNKIKRSFLRDIEKGDLIAKALKKAGIKPGDKIPVSVPCIPEFRYIYYAINKIGAISVWLDFRAGENEIKEHLESIGDYKACFLFNGVCEKIENILNEIGNKATIIEISPSETIPEIFVSKILEFKEKIARSKKFLQPNKISYKEFISLAINEPNFECYNFPPNSTAVIVYTGGTTGVAKGVELTNENFNAVVNGYENTSIDFSVGDKFLQFLPPWTAYGLVIDYVCFKLGLSSDYIAKLDPDTYDELILKEKPQHTTGIPKNLEILTNSRKIKVNTDLSYFKTAAVGADTMNINKERSTNEFLDLHNSQAQVIKGYGMTEGCATICTTSNQINKLGSVGIPFVKNNIKVICLETGEELSYGEIGEICYTGPSIMKRYFANEEETREMLIIDEKGRKWIKSGDLGYIDKEGFLFIVGRKKRMFIRSGFKIFPLNIENIIGKHPDVESVVVVGIPSELEGCSPVVNIKVKENSRKSQEEIIDELNELCRKELYEYYFPLRYVFVEAIPYTKNGKVDFMKLTADLTEKQEDSIKKLKLAK